MKKIVFTILILLVFCGARSQEAPEAFARQMADRIKDSLGLTVVQTDSIYQINLELHYRKQKQWKLYSATDSLQKHVQAIENGRDSLYKGVLTLIQFELYMQRKSNLIRKN